MAPHQEHQVGMPTPETQSQGGPTAPVSPTCVQSLGFNTSTSQHESAQGVACELAKGEIAESVNQSALGKRKHATQHLLLDDEQVVLAATALMALAHHKKDK